MIIHVPRVLWTLARGMASPQPMVGLNGRPHVYTARVNALLDADQFLHMNNAAYSVHFEMARWEMSAANGLMRTVVSDKLAFIVASGVSLAKRNLPHVMCCSDVHVSPRAMPGLPISSRVEAFAAV